MEKSLVETEDEEEIIKREEPITITSALYDLTGFYKTNKAFSSASAS